MATIKNTLALQDNMSKTLSSITKAMSSTLMVMEKIKSNKLGPEFQQAANDIKNAEKQIQNFNDSIKDVSDSFSKASGASGSFFKSILGASAVQKAFSMITNSIGGAISRYDTLNNYVNVMKNLGVSEDQANASREVLAKGLQGLPTELNDAVLAVQRFTAVNKSIGGSTKMYLALNNALLAGGTSAQTQALALEQISQAYSKGKPDAMEWKAMLNVMPAQLDQIAKAMNTTTTQLGDDLKSGKVSMNDFMKTIIKLNEEGVNGLDNFAQQAKAASKGIGTAIANMNSAIKRGIAEVAKGIDAGLAAIGLGSMSEIIINYGAFIENTLKNLASKISSLISMMAPAINLIKTLGKIIHDNWDLIVPVLGTVIALMTAYKSAVIATTVVEGISNAVKTIGIISSVAHGAAITKEMLATTGMTKAQLEFNAALYACPLTWIVVAIIAVIGAIYLAVAAVNHFAGTSISATGVILGAFAVLGAFLWDLFVGLIDIASIVINWWIEKWVAFANFFANIFNDPIAAIIHLFADLGSRVLGILSGIAAAIDAIFGSNLKAAVSGWENSLQSKANELADKYGNGSYEKKINYERISSENLGLKRIGYGDAWDAGYGAGSKFGKGGATDNAIKDALADLDTGLGEMTGSDGKGGKALKTTSNDDLLSDDDIKLLLDVATRDYKLNYQQITPNVSVTFGDVRETANIDDVMDAVGSRIEALVYGDAEVPM